jgi:hypothetical protein
VRLYGPRTRPPPEQRRDADGGYGERAPAAAVASVPPAQPSDRSFDEWLTAEERQREYEMVGAPRPPPPPQQQQQQQRREQRAAAAGGDPRGGSGGDARGEARVSGGAARGVAPVPPTAGWQDRLEGGASRGGPPRRERGPPPPPPLGGVRTTGLSFRKEDRADRGRGGGTRDGRGGGGPPSRGGASQGERGTAGDRASRPRALPPDGPRRDGW